MKAQSRIYLDNAATSWPKPETVYTAVDKYHRELGAPAGRSAYAQAGEVSRLVEQARINVARILGIGDSSRVAFCFNGTDALNTAIHGALRDGDHAVTSDAEHNSVLRPLSHLAARHGIAVSYVACDSAGRVDPDDVRRALRPNTRLVALAHVSNVTGTIQPLGEVGRLVRKHGALFLVDAAQSLGHLPFTVDELECDLLAAPGHKGLLGPLGTGILYVRPGLEAQLQSFRQGGTGSQSESEQQPDAMPAKFESGNHNVAGIVGLGAGCQFLLERGIEKLHSAASRLSDGLRSALSSNAGVTVYGPARSDERVGVISINVSGYDPQEIASALDAHYGVQIRAGLHCAARIHTALQTAQLGGTVRFSLGPFNTADHISVAAKAITEISSA